jgi:hypothetical protein
MKSKKFPNVASLGDQGARGVGAISPMGSPTAPTSPWRAPLRAHLTRAGCVLARVFFIPLGVRDLGPIWTASKGVVQPLSDEAVFCGPADVDQRLVRYVSRH